MILIVILLSIIAFFGVFTKENGIWKNHLPDVSYGMDLKGARELIYVVSNKEDEKYVYVDEAGNIKGEVWKEGKAITEDDEKSSSEETTEGDGQEETTNSEETKTSDTNEVPYTKETRTIKKNPDDVMNKKNFEQSKKIIQKRLKEQGIDEYHIRIDDITGKIVIENASDNEEVSRIEQLVANPGKFQIIDYQTGVVLMDNSDIKQASVVYSNNETYQTYLQIQFNKAGSEKLKEISNQYIEIKEETQEVPKEENTETTEEDTDKETEKKYVSIVFDDTTMMTTYFGEEMANGILQISVGQARTEHKDFMEDYNSAKTIADMLNTGVLPVTYELETDNFVKSAITEAMLETLKIVVIIAIIIISLILIIKFKKKGALAAVLNIGYIALLSIVLRYAKVEITINAMISLIFVMGINVVFLKMFLQKCQISNNGEAYKQVCKEFYLTIVPLIVIAIVFTLTQYYAINSIGMVIFWGIFLQGLYNLLLTKTLLNNRKD